MKLPIGFFNEPEDGGNAPVARPAIRFFDESENGGNVPAARPAIRFFDEPEDGGTPTVRPAIKFFNEPEDGGNAPVARPAIKLFDEPEDGGNQSSLVSVDETEETSYAKFTVIKDDAVNEHHLVADCNHSEPVPVAESQQQYIRNVSTNEKAEEALIKMYCAVKKTELINQEELDKEKRRAELREKISEQREESRRSRYQEIIVTTDGEILAQTRNLNIDASSRAVFNFSRPRLYCLECTNGEKGYYRLEFLLDGAEEKSFTFLKADRCGEPKYILRKILFAGGDTLTDNMSHRQDYVAKLWTVLLRTCEPLSVSDKYGWVCMGGKYLFIKKGELIWKDIVICAM